MTLSFWLESHYFLLLLLPFLEKLEKERQLETRFGTLKKAVTNLRVTEEDSEGEEKEEDFCGLLLPLLFFCSQGRERESTNLEQSIINRGSHPQNCFPKKESLPQTRHCREFMAK